MINSWINQKFNKRINTYNRFKRILIGNDSINIILIKFLRKSSVCKFLRLINVLPVINSIKLCANERLFNKWRPFNSGILFKRLFSIFNNVNFVKLKIECSTLAVVRRLFESSLWKKKE